MKTFVPIDNLNIGFVTTDGKIRTVLISTGGLDPKDSYDGQIALRDHVCALLNSYAEGVDA